MNLSNIFFYFFLQISLLCIDGEGVRLWLLALAFKGNIWLSRGSTLIFVYLMVQANILIPSGFGHYFGSKGYKLIYGHLGA